MRSGGLESNPIKFSNKLLKIKHPTSNLQHFLNYTRKKVVKVSEVKELNINDIISELKKRKGTI